MDPFTKRRKSRFAFIATCLLALSGFAGTNIVTLSPYDGRLETVSKINRTFRQLENMYSNGVAVVTNSATNYTSRLQSNTWAAADSTTNYVLRSGGTVYSNLVVDVGQNLGGLEVVASYGIPRISISSSDDMGSSYCTIATLNERWDIAVTENDATPGLSFFRGAGQTDRIIRVTSSQVMFFKPLHGNGSGITNVSGTVGLTANVNPAAITNLVISNGLIVAVQP